LLFIIAFVNRAAGLFKLKLAVKINTFSQWTTTFVIFHSFVFSMFDKVSHS